MRKTLPWTLAPVTCKFAFRLIEPQKRFLNASPRGLQHKSKAVLRIAFSKHFICWVCDPDRGPDHKARFQPAPTELWRKAGGFRLMAFLALRRRGEAQSLASVRDRINQEFAFVAAHSQINPAIAKGHMTDVNQVPCGG